MERPRIRLGFRSVNEVARALVIIGLVGLALAAVGIWTAVRTESRRRTVKTEPLRPWPAVVLFTSIDCDACEPVRETIQSCAPQGIVREIAYQGGAELFQSAGIERVPSVVAIDQRGAVVAVLEGAVGLRRMRRALGRAGLMRGHKSLV